MLVINDKILVAGNNGMYEIAGSKYKQIIMDRYINCIISSKINPGIIYACSSDGLIIVNFENGKWNTRNVDAPINENITSVYEKDSIVWLGTDNIIYKLNSSFNYLVFLPSFS